MFGDLDLQALSGASVALALVCIGFYSLAAEERTETYWKSSNRNGGHYLYSSLTEEEAVTIFLGTSDMLHFEGVLLVGATCERLKPFEKNVLNDEISPF